ncbi:MAG TPA: LCP family protein [Spirochaetia bacterium]|nr:LCP family protein [Spirochaetia bacterium]
MAKKQFDKGIIFLILVILIVIVTIVFFVFTVRTDPISESIKNGDALKVLFSVTDGEEILFSEVFFYNPQTHRGALFDMPGDIGSIIDSLKKIDRIDILYKKGNIQPFKQKIETLVGTDVPYYIRVEKGMVSKLVDILEGIEVFIANPVEEVSPERTILLPSGSVLLDGDKTEDFILFEDEGESELEKISRRQKFIQALLKGMGKNSTVLSHDKVFPLFAHLFETNMKDASLKAFVREMARLDVENIVFQRVLGVRRMVDEKNLLFPHYEGKLLRETVGQTLETLSNPDILADSVLTLSVEILNGTAVSGLAGRTAQLFQSFGFEIAGYKNAEHSNYEKTIVIDNRGNPEFVQRVSSIIRCKNIEVRSQEEGLEPPSSDVTIVLGKDFDGRYCKE